jgi:1-deoxy-D-xylulose-5-phosphate reductoisomerase
VVAVAQATAAQDLQLAFYAEAQVRGFAAGDFAIPKILAGPEAATEIAGWPCDVVLNGMTGSIGLAPTLAALAAGRTLALANKESLIAGGPLVQAALQHPDQIVPVDSEHSALAQCLRGGRAQEVRRLVLTASGGPFRGRGRADLAAVTPEQALAHPTWDMGPVITVNSATLVNKGLEVIEAHLLFGTPYSSLDVVVHPQSVVHSMVEFVDGSTLAQASPPDMRLPIGLALSWPTGCRAVVRHRLDPRATWGFEPLDDEAFPAVALCKAAGARGGTAPAALNAANEVCVEAFLAGRLPFLGIVDTVAQVVERPCVQGTSDTGRGVGDGGRGTSPRPGGDRPVIVLGFVAFVVALFVSVVLHEAGHFLTARRFGMKATHFFAGFGPTLWSRRAGRRSTASRRSPPVASSRSSGMTPLEEIAPEDEPRAFYRQSAGKKAIVLAAGSTVHFLIAIALISARPRDRRAVEKSPGLETIAACVPVAADQTCEDPGALPSPAEQAGLRSGDVVVAVDGEPVDGLLPFVNAGARRAGATGRPHGRARRHPRGRHRHAGGRRAPDLRGPGADGDGRRHRRPAEDPAGHRVARAARRRRAQRGDDGPGRRAHRRRLHREAPDARRRLRPRARPRGLHRRRRRRADQR